jgi:hypothetical protein
LRAHLLGAVGSGCAANHFVHAKAAEAEFQDLIQADVDDSGGSVAEFGLFLAFAHDVIDRYSRLLAFVDRDDPVAQPRPYNEHLLAAGVALPYFIWPNVAPFIREADVPEPGVPIGGAHLDAARNAVATARTEQRGIFAPPDPLRLLPFELRYLARATTGTSPHRSGPDRWVIDISTPTSNLLGPQRFIEIPNPGGPPLGQRRTRAPVHRARVEHASLTPRVANLQPPRNLSNLEVDPRWLVQMAATDRIGDRRA